MARLFAALGLLSWASCGVAENAAREKGQDLIPNGDMEQNGGWHSMQDGKPALPIVNEQTFDEKHSGKASRHIVITRQVGRSWPSVISASFATELSKTYEVRFWYKVLKGGFTVVVRNGADNDNLTPKPKAMCAPRYEMTKKQLVWTEYVCTYTEDKGGKGAYLRLIIASHNEVEFYLDDVSVREIDISVESALRDWRKLFPGREFVCWSKSPWENLLPAQFPPQAPRECKRLSVSMGQNEFESCSFVFSSLSDHDLSVEVSMNDPALPIVLRQAMWVTDIDGAKINDALPLLEGKIAVPSGESREFWLTVRTRGQAAGDYKTPIKITSQDASVTIVLDVTVHPVTLPDDKPLYTHYWDELVPEWCGAEVAKALVEDMKRHYVNVAITNPWPARMQFDGKGKLKTDYTDLDKTLDAYRLLDPKLIVFWWGAVNYLEPQKGFFSDEWKLRFRTWLTSLVSHLKEKGWGYDRFAMNPYDERLGPEVCRLAKLVKEIDPKIRVFVNSTGQTEQEVRDIAPYVDIWDPYLYDYLNEPPYDRLLKVKETAAKVLRNSVKDEFFWTYANPPGSRPKAAPPYRDYRVPLWRAWQLGMRGFGYWVYSYKTHWNSKKTKDGPGWAVVYLANADDAPAGVSQKELVVPSKRWEATREGVEDYVYLYMLREAVREAEKHGRRGKALEHARAVLRESPKRVLAEPTNHALADAAKEEILKAIVSLRPAGD
jgi:hypothetical protein